MQRLAVQIEVKGAFKQVGEIVGTSSDDARFTYTESPFPLPFQYIFRHTQVRSILP